MEPVQRLPNWENLTEIQGAVHSVHVDQERGGVVLRFVIKLVSGEKLAVEMRGYEVRGLLEVDDQIVIRGRRLRDRDGVIRPREVWNITNGSTVTVRRAGVLVRFFSSAFALIISVMSGAATTLLVTLFSRFATPPPISSPPERPPGGSPPILPSVAGDTTLLTAAIMLGISVGLLVFYLIFLRSRIR